MQWERSTYLRTAYLRTYNKIIIIRSLHIGTTIIFSDKRRQRRRNIIQNLQIRLKYKLFHPPEFWERMPHISPHYLYKNGIEKGDGKIHKEIKYLRK